MPLASSNTAHSSATAALLVPARLAVAGAAGATGLLWLTTLLFVGRRLAGALVQPLSLPLLIAVAVALSLVALLLHRFWQGRQPLDAGTSLAIVLLALAVSLPGTSLLGLLVLWAILGLEEAWAWATRVPLLACPAVSSPAALGTAGQASSGTPSEIDPGLHSPSSVAEILRSAQEDASENELSEEELPADDVLQQLVRRRLPDGREELTGWLRVPLAAGQRTANVHLAFCPPFAQAPQVAVEQQDGLPARIKLVQSLPFGARLDLKLAEVAEESSTVVLYVQATTAP